MDGSFNQAYELVSHRNEYQSLLQQQVKIESNKQTIRLASKV